MRNRLTALLVAAGIVAITFPSLALTSGWKVATLTPDQSEFDWDGWHVKITRIFFTSSVPGTEDDGKEAEEGSIFVCLAMTVTNTTTNGMTFIPQNSLKIELAGNHFDAEDIDPTWNNMRNIEPTMTRTRQCYFELPTNLVNDSFAISFSGLLSDRKLISVSITAPVPTPTPQPRTLAATPVPQETPPTNDQQTDNTAQANFVTRINRALDNHDWRTLTEMTVSGLVNYFGHRHVTNTFIAQDMANDSRNYLWVHSTPYPNTFTHEVSDQYSSYWSGPMLYDSINVYSLAQEKNGRLHEALTRLTVGYVIGPSGKPAIYSLTLKVLEQGHKTF
jgi:hypothetical protein